MTGQPIQNKIGFNLRQGMSGSELWQELNRVGISGETTQEVYEFKTPQLYHRQYDNIPLHNVKMDNSRYAIIGKSFVYEDIFGGLNESWSYYLAGINDEHKYFIRPIDNFEPKKQPVTVEQVIDWVNRVDEGFDRRIQGDVLIKYVEKSKVKFDKKNPYDTAGNIPYNANFENKRYQSTVIQPIKLGNHRLFCDGEVFIGMQSSEILIKGQSIMLKHDEHKFVNESISDNMVVILAPQRGRTFNLSNYLRRAFD